MAPALYTALLLAGLFGEIAALAAALDRRGGLAVSFLWQSTGATARNNQNLDYVTSMLAQLTVLYRHLLLGALAQNRVEPATRDDTEASRNP